MFLRKWTLKFQNKFFNLGSLSDLVNSISKFLIIFKNLQNARSLGLWTETLLCSHENGRLNFKINSSVLDHSLFWLILHQIAILSTKICKILHHMVCEIETLLMTSIFWLNYKQSRSLVNFKINSSVLANSRRE